MEKFDTINYLSEGNDLQKQCFDILTHHKVFEHLKNYNPILIGTIPIDIATKDSDLDIACHWTDKANFISSVKKDFSKHIGFKITEAFINDVETVIANFHINAFEVEIFGQNIPVQQQNGYRHMIIEAEILEKESEIFRKEIIRLKENGMKTEPAFANLLQLEGNPYEALLNYKP